MGGTSSSKVADLVSSSAPSTVAANVKNVQGFKGAALRGFLGIYPDTIHQIVDKGSPILRVRCWSDVGRLCDRLRSFAFKPF